MTFSRLAGIGTSVAALALLAVGPAFAADAPKPESGNVTWMLVSSIIVLMMTVPGLALFYGGLVRAKNMLSVLTQVLAIVCMVALIWVVYGYSLAFTPGGGLNSFIGGFDKMFLAGVTTESNVETFSKGVVIPELAFVLFQMTFACITPALIIGAFAERIKFSALMVFSALWVTFVYFPVAHMVWFWGGPSAYQDPTGLIFSFGAIDFAGGTVVHINAGIAALVGCLVIGKRIGYGKDSMPPHSLVMTMIGASLLWVGWFGFNAGSNLEANAYAVLAAVNTFVATAAAGMAWLIVEWMAKGKPSLLGLASGVVAGLVAVTPAAGFVGPMGAIAIGLVSGAVCFIFCSAVKNALGYDDSLDVFGIHGVGGIIGAILTGIFVNPALGGAGIVDYSTCDAAGVCKTAEYVLGTQLYAQTMGVLITIAWSGVISFILFKVVDVVIGLRVAPDKEREGLDLVDHGERAYNS